MFQFWGFLVLGFSGSGVFWFWGFLVLGFCGLGVFRFLGFPVLGFSGFKFLKQFKSSLWENSGF